VNRRVVWRRVLRVGTATIALGLCPLVMEQQSHAATTQALLSPAPLIPIVEEILAGIGTGSGTLAIASTGTAAAVSLTTDAIIAAAVYAGTTYATYKTLKFFFPAGSHNAQQPSLGVVSHTGYNKITTCTSGATAGGVTYGASNAGLTFSARCGPYGTGDTSTNFYAPNINWVSWRCVSASPCAQYFRVVAVGLDGVTELGTTADPCAWGTALYSSPNTGGTCGGNGYNPTPGRVANTVGGYYLEYDPTKIQWNVGSLHRWRVITTCKNKSTSATTTGTTYSDQFWDVDANLPEFTVPQCLSSEIATHLEIWEGDSAGSTGTKVYTWDAPADVIVTTPTSPYKDCYPGGSAFPCIIEIWKVQTDGSLKTCMSGTVDCSTYDHTQTQTQQYECRWGTHILPTGYCKPVEPWIKTTTDIPAATPTPTPTGTTTTGTSTGPTTTTTVVPVPTAGRNIDPKTGEERTGTSKPSDGTDDTGSNCMADTWSWNPVNWVYIPIKCALQWALVPKTATMTSLGTRVKTALSASAPGRWVGAVDNLKAGLPNTSESGCLGPRLAWDKLPGGEMYPFKACDGVMATAAALTKLLATIAVTFFGGLACLRALGSGLGWSPGIGKE